MQIEQKWVSAQKKLSLLLDALNPTGPKSYQFCFYFCVNAINATPFRFRFANDENESKVHFAFIFDWGNQNQHLNNNLGLDNRCNSWSNKFPYILRIFHWLVGWRGITFSLHLSSWSARDSDDRIKMKCKIIFGDLENYRCKCYAGRYDKKTGQSNAIGCCGWLLFSWAHFALIDWITSFIKRFVSIKIHSKCHFSSLGPTKKYKINQTIS